jgi:hypothetical protein
VNRITWQIRLLALCAAVILITWFTVASCSYLTDRERVTETQPSH